MGHTKVFFRAGALAALEEARDGIVLKLVRWLQGEVYGRIKRREFQKKSDQRELMKVIQRNFRKYMTLRTWGWFIIIQKTKPLIGQINLEDELRMLEEAANAKFGAYEEQLKTKVLYPISYLSLNTLINLSCTLELSKDSQIFFRLDLLKTMFSSKKKPRL